MGIAFRAGAFSLALFWSTCGGPAEPEEDELELSTGDEEEEGPLPALRRVGQIAAGPYLFDGAAIERPEDSLHMAVLVAVEVETFTLAVDDEPHRDVSRAAAWPMACVTRRVELREGDLLGALEPGAPVFILASDSTAARISPALHSEHSVVVPRTRLRTDACAPPAPEPTTGWLATVEEGDVPCLFPDQETLDDSAGLPLPSGAPARILNSDGAWARVRVHLRGGHVEGWASAALVSSEGAPPAPAWSATALTRSRCVFPDRPEARPWEHTPGEDLGLPPPTIPAIEVERVVRNNGSQIQACYEARRNELPELSVSLEVLMLVDADGHVSDVDVTLGADADEALTRCVIERVRRWRFPPPRSGTVNVRQRFELRPPG